MICILHAFPAYPLLAPYAFPGTYDTTFEILFLGDIWPLSLNKLSIQALSLYVVGLSFVGLIKVMQK